ncbi:solute carrier family 23 protein [uncultured Methanoregula sp.]|uniref:solute carrier family 23 protein n=1 Tax=uncultured Methanoregula sp. TaxID=1005933 RepID=UPI002AAB4251|nr:solute carrier family 23 protein [uncultured Methanoregula sp.]
MKLLSQIDEIPPAKTLIVATLQWFIILMPSALIYGMMVAPMLYTEPALQMQVIQAVFVVSGIFQILQVFIGHRLPIGVGPTAIIIIGVGAGLAYTTNAIFTAMILCGLAICGLAVVKAHHLLKKLFTFNIIVTVLLMGCFAVTPMILGLIIPSSPVANPTDYLVFAILFTLFIIGLSGFLRGMAKQLLLPFAMILGVVLYVLVFPFQVPAISSAPFGLFSGIVPTGFEFSLPLLVAFLFCFFTVLVIDFSAVESMELTLRPEGMDRRFRAGMAVTGLSSVAAGLAGTIGCANSNFSMNVVLASRQGSRYPLACAGILFLIIGFSPVIVSTLMAIPTVVIACLFIYLLGGMFAATLSLAKKRSGGIGYNSGLVIGVALIFATLIAFLPVTTKTLMGNRIEPVLANSFIVGIFSALVIEHIFFRGQAEQEIQREEEKEATGGQGEQVQPEKGAG